VARTDEGAELTRSHRSLQLALRSALIAELLLLWPAFDPRKFDTYERFMGMAAILIAARYRDSVGLAARYFRDFRAAERVPGAAFPLLADVVPDEQIKTSLRATGLAQTIRAIRSGKAPEAAAEQGFVAAAGAAGRLTLNGGRQTVIESARVDTEAQRWLRVTDGDPCFFCAMVASRGAVYTEQTVRFEAHDHCGCVPEPYYPGSEEPLLNQQFRDLWNETTTGLGGREAVNAFRAAIEQRA
jgi:hypothetical protein